MTKKDYKRNNNTATWQQNKQLDEVQQRLLFLNIKLDMELKQNLSEPDCRFELKFSLSSLKSVREPFVGNYKPKTPLRVLGQKNQEATGGAETQGE